MNQEYDDRELDDRLRADAAGQGPSFSEPLHERIMSRIADVRAKQARRPLRRWVLIPAAMAAAVLLAIGLFVHMNQPAPTKVTPARMVAKLPSIPSIRNPVGVLDQPIVAEWTQQRYAYLDRDGEEVVGYMARQLDVAGQIRITKSRITKQ